MRRAPSPVVALNRAVAVAEVEGPAAGLDDRRRARRRTARLGAHAPLSAARADLLRRLGRDDEAAAEAYARPRASTGNPAERGLPEGRAGASGRRSRRQPA